MMRSGELALALAVLAACAPNSHGHIPTLRLSGGGSRSLLMLPAHLPQFIRGSSPLRAAVNRPQAEQSGEQGREIGGDLEHMKGQVERSIEINATPDECFRVASGFEFYPKWAGCNYVRVLKEGPHGIGELVQMKVGMFGRNLDYTLAYKHTPSRKMTWHAVSGSIKALMGSYEFVPIGPSRTKVVYKLNVDPGFWLPSAIKAATQRTVAGAALNELKKYTELPSTKARLAGGVVSAPMTEQEIESDRQRVYQLARLL